MKITVVKTYKSKAVVTAEREVADVEQLIVFATQLGVRQNFEEYVADFESLADRTYIVSLEHVN